MILIIPGRINTNSDSSLCSGELLNVLHHENKSSMVTGVGMIGEASDTLD